MRRQLTAEQQAKSAERKAKFRALWKTVAAMPELERIQTTARLGLITCEGRELSLANQMLIAIQIPTATILGGFRQWIKQGRAVRKGEHGAMIWVPTNKSCNADLGGGAGAEGLVNPGANEQAGENGENLRFVIGTVFDIGQTDEIENGTTAIPAAELQEAAA